LRKVDQNDFFAVFHWVCLKVLLMELLEENIPLF